MRDAAPGRGGPARLLEGALVVTMDDAWRIGRFTVIVREGVIEAVEAPDAAGLPEGAERVDCAGRILMPGLVNAHLHPELHAARGLLEGLTLRDWSRSTALSAALAWLGGADGRGAVRAATRAALGECLLGGITRVGVYGVVDGAPEIQAEELTGLGLRGHVTIRDLAFAPVEGLPVPHVYRLHAEEALTEAELAAAAGAHGRGERIVIHVAETEWRRDLCRERFGTTPLRLLDRWGLLSPRVLLSHAVYAEPEEIQRVARSGAPVVASPTAELKLSDGIAPVAEYLAAGAAVALGTDAAVCNNGTDLFLEMRQLGLTQSLRYGPGALDAERILRAATRDGARALGATPEAGTIAAGAPADLVLLDTASPRLQPLVHDGAFSNVVPNLVFAATAADVSDVMIAGEWRVRGRRLVGVDAEELWSDLGRAGRDLHDNLRRA